MFLRLLLAEGRERAAELAPEVVEDRAGDHDPAGLGELLEAGGDVHAIAVDVLALDDHVAEVDADPEANALGLGHARLPLGHAALDRDRARHGVDDGGELAERAVAHQLDDAAAVLGDERLGQLLAVRLEAIEGAGLLTLHQPAVAGHVRGEDGGEATLGPCRRAHWMAVPWRMAQGTAASDGKERRECVGHYRLHPSGGG